MGGEEMGLGILAPEGTKGEQHRSQNVRVGENQRPRSLAPAKEGPIECSFVFLTDAPGKPHKQNVNAGGPKCNGGGGSAPHSRCFLLGGPGFQVLLQRQLLKDENVGVPLDNLGRAEGSGIPPQSQAGGL